MSTKDVNWRIQPMMSTNDVNLRIQPMMSTKDVTWICQPQMSTKDVNYTKDVMTLENKWAKNWNNVYFRFLKFSGWYVEQSYFNNITIWK